MMPSRMAATNRVPRPASSDLMLGSAMSLTAACGGLYGFVVFIPEDPPVFLSNLPRFTLFRRFCRLRMFDPVRLIPVQVAELALGRRGYSPGDSLWTRHWPRMTPRR